MSVQTLITRLTQNIANAFTALRSLGVTVPDTAKSDNLQSLIESIPVLKYYTGTSAPSNSLGEDGDLYLLT